MASVERFAWLNGRIVRREEAAVSAFAEGFLYGLGAFETFRWNHPWGVFRWEPRRERLGRALAALGVPDPTDDFLAAVGETVAANEVAADVVARLTVAAGAPSESPIRLIALREIAHGAELAESGGSARLEIATFGDFARHKTTQYAAYRQGRLRALEGGFTETLFVDPDGAVLEGAASNLFLATPDGRLATPPLTRPILPGITRGIVLELAERCGVPFKERDISAEELSKASEAFLTNSIVELLPVTRIDGRAVGSGRPGPLTKRLHDAYRTLVQSERTDA